MAVSFCLCVPILVWISLGKISLPLGVRFPSSREKNGLPAELGTFFKDGALISVLLEDSCRVGDCSPAEERLPVWSFGFSEGQRKRSSGGILFPSGSAPRRGLDSWHQDFSYTKPICDVRCSGATVPLALTLCLCFPDHVPVFIAAWLIRGRGCVTPFFNWNQAQAVVPAPVFVYLPAPLLLARVFGQSPKGGNAAQTCSL